MRPMPAAVARLDPDAAATPALAKLDATARPPGKKANHLLPTLNSDTISPPLLASAPMNMNMGMAVSDQLAVKVYGMSPAMLNAATHPRIAAIPMNDTNPRDTPMGIPDKSSAMKIGRAHV